MPSKFETVLQPRQILRKAYRKLRLDAPRPDMASFLAAATRLYVDPRALEKSHLS